MFLDRARQGLLITTLVATAAVPSFAFADDGELPVAVLTIQTLDAFEQADALTNAMKRAIEDAPGWSTAQLEKDYALLVLSNSLGCADPPDAACEEKIAAEIKVDRFLWGQLKKDGADVTGDLHLWIKGKGGKYVPFRYSANLTTSADETLIEIARVKFAELAGGPPGGKLRLMAGNLNGEVTVDGQPAGKMTAGVAIVELTPGPHKIKVVSPGYETMEASVDLKPREEKNLKLTPVVEEQGPDIQKILGVTALGVGAIAAGVATYAGVRVLQLNSELEPYRSGADPDWVFVEGQDGCISEGNYPNIALAEGQTNANDEKLTQIQDICNEGKTFQTMTLGLWPVAGAFAGTGIILLATADWSGGSPKEAKLPFLVWPSFGPGGGFVSVASSF